jgi:protein-disulfide isomerase
MKTTVNLFILVLLVLSIGLNALILKELHSVKEGIRIHGERLSSAVEEVRRIKSPSTAPAAPEQPSEVRISIDDDPIKGDPKAPVTIVEFSDYQCPFCRRFHEQTLPSLETDYISKGKVRYVFRDYPLQFHQNAFPAALAANCAGEQGKYWEINDFLFKNPDKLDIPNILGSARGLGLNREELERCINEKRYESEINKDMEDGGKYGVRGTPSFFIGKTEGGKEISGVYIRGAQPYQVFKVQIDKLLGGDKG